MNNLKQRGEDLFEALSFQLRQLETARTLLEDLYTKRADINKKIYSLEADKKIAESEALMNLEGNGKDCKTTYNGQVIALPNTTTIDAFRRVVSANTRREIAVRQGSLAEIEGKIDEAKNRILKIEKILDAMIAQSTMLSVFVSKQ